LNEFAEVYYAEDMFSALYISRGIVWFSQSVPTKRKDNEKPIGRSLVLSRLLFILDLLVLGTMI
jgi:hypothetical protein